MTTYTTPHSLPLIEPAVDKIKDTTSASALAQDINSLAQATNSGLDAVVVKAVDAIPGAIDASPTISAMQGDLLKRVPFRSVKGNINMDDLKKTEDVLLTSMDAVLNAPDTSSGVVSVRDAGGNVTQTWSSAVRKTGNSWVRVYAQSSWGGWMFTGPEGSPPARATSFNDLRTIGITRIQFVDHPSQPIAATGALQILPASGAGLVQEFTTWESPPRRAARRSTGATTWGTWGITPLASEVAGLGSRVGALESASSGSGTSAVPRGVLAVGTMTTESLPARDTVGAMSNDRMKVWTAYNTTLRESVDDGKTWTDIYTFGGFSMESTMQTGDGELLVTGAHGGRGRRVVLKSTGYSTPELSFTEVMEAREPGIKFTSSWSQATYDNIVLVAEYGPKSGAAWAGVDGIVATGANARYVYMSVNYGKTWTTVFDLNNYLTADRELATTDGQHLHGVAWDSYWDRIWVTFGDDTDGIVYSDDMGETWHTAVWSSVAVSPTQAVGIVVMPKCVLFGSDNYNPSTVYRINRAEGKHHSGNYTLDSAFKFTGGGKHLLQGHYRGTRRGDDAPALFSFCAEGVPSKSFVTATLDGYTFTELWRETVDQAAGMGARNIVGPTTRGNFIWSSADAKVPGMWSQYRMKATGY